MCYNMLKTLKMNNWDIIVPKLVIITISKSDGNNIYIFRIHGASHIINIFDAWIVYFGLRFIETINIFAYLQLVPLDVYISLLLFEILTLRLNTTGRIDYNFAFALKTSILCKVALHKIFSKIFYMIFLNLYLVYFFYFFFFQGDVDAASNLFTSKCGPKPLLSRLVQPLNDRKVYLFNWVVRNIL